MATLRFVYVSMDGYKVLEFDGDKAEMKGIQKEYERKAKVLGKALKTKQEPEPTESNECNWCGYRKEGKRPIKKPKRSRK